MPTSNAIRRAILLAFGLVGQAATSADLPSGGTVVGGAATIVQNGTNQVITQTTANAVINWNNFSIGAGNSVRINQLSSSSVLLNRVTGNNPSTILGNLSANGQVFLVNPLGIFFGTSAIVDVGGLVATTMNISNDDFMAGRYSFSRDNTLAARQEVINQGVIKARENGYVVLAGDYAANRGAIEARFGTAALASGSRMTLDIQGDSLINFAVNEKTVAALSGVDNSGQILADGGKAIMTASVATDLTTAVVNNSGLIRASTTVERDGAIYLSADGGNTQVSGTLDASGTGTGQKGGIVQVLGEKVALIDSAVVNASGTTGGGTINIGGNYQGNGPLKNASSTYVGKDVHINADATVKGNGGNVVVWADNQTRFYGYIGTRGGALGGNGGNIEVSGKQWLDFQGAVNTLAINGLAGTLLLDPTDINIVTDDPDPASPNPTELQNDGTGVFSATPPLAVSTIGIGRLEGLLGSSNVKIQTTSSASAPNGGSITIDDGSGGGVQWSSNHSLTLQADHNIIVKSAVETTGSGAITFNAANDIVTDAAVRTNGGALTLDSGNSVTNNATVSSNGGVITLDGNQITVNGNINAGSGEVRLHSNGVTQNSGNSISGNSLLLTGGPGGNGNWEMAQSGNSFNTVAMNLATSGTVRLRNNKALTIGAVNGTSGISVANGNVELNVQGALSVSDAVKAKKAYFNGTSGITQTAAGRIETDELRLTGGAVTLTNNDNKVGILSANINGAFVWSDTNDILTVGKAYDGFGIRTNNNNVTITTGNSSAYDPESLPSATNKASLTLNESINAGSGTVRLTTGKGGVYQRNDLNNGTPLEAGSITASRLLLNNVNTTEVASFVLNNSFNRVNTLAGETTGSISYAGGALTIGSIDGIAGLKAKAKVIGARVDPQTQEVIDIINDNNITLSIGGDLNINENLTATSSVGGSDTVNVGIGGDYKASTAAGKIISAKTLGVFGEDGKGTFLLKSNVSQLAAGGGKKMVIDNSTYTGELTGIAIGGQAASIDTSNPELGELNNEDISAAAKPVGDFYLTTGGKLNVLTLNSKGQNLLLRSTALSILLDAATANNAHIMLQPFDVNSSIGINNATEAGFNPGINYDAATLLKFKNPTATFYFGTAPNNVQTGVDAAAKDIFKGDIHIGKDGAFNLGYRSLSAQTTGNLVAYNVGPLYNLRLVAENLRINGFNTYGDQLHFFTNNLELPGTAANYINPNKPNITLRPLSNHTIWIGNRLVNKNYEPVIRSQTLVKLPDGSTIIISGSTDFAYTSGSLFAPGPFQNGDIHIPWNDLVSLGNRKLILSTGADVKTYPGSPLFTEKNDGGKSGGLWQGCQNLATCKGTNPPTETPPNTGGSGNGSGGSGGGTGNSSGDGGSCATCPPAQPDPNYPTPGTTTPGTGTNPNSSNPGTNPGSGTTPGSTDTGDGDGGGSTGGGGNGNGNDGNPNTGIGTGTGNDGGGTGGGGNGSGSGNTGDGSGDGGANNGSGGNGNGSGGTGDGSGSGGSGSGSGGIGDGDGNGGAGGGNGSGGSGTGGDGDGSGDGGASNGSGGNGNGSGGTGDGDGSGGAGNGTGGVGDGDGNGGAGGGNGSGGSGTGGDGDGSGDGGASNGSGGNGNGSGGTGDGDGSGGSGNGSGGVGDGDGDGGNGSGGIGDGNGDSGNGNGSGGIGNGDDGNGSGSGGNGEGDGDGGAGNGSGGTGDGNGDGGNGRGSGGTGDGNGDGGNGSGPGGNGGDDGDGGSGNGSGGTSDGNGNGDDDDQSDTSSDTNTPAFDISCDDATEVGKRKERTDQKGRETLVEVTKEGLKLQDPCQQQKKDDSRSR